MKNSSIPQKAIAVILLAGLTVTFEGGGQRAFAQDAPVPAQTSGAKDHNLKMVQELVDRKKFTDAFKELERLEQQYPNDLQVTVAYGRTLWKKGEDVRPDRMLLPSDREKRRKEKLDLYTRALSYYNKAKQSGALPETYEGPISTLRAEIDKLKAMEGKDLVGSVAALANVITNKGRINSSPPAPVSSAPTVGAIIPADANTPTTPFPLYLTGEWTGLQTGGNAPSVMWKLTLYPDGAFINRSVTPDGTVGTWTHDKGVVRLTEMGRLLYSFDVYKANAMMAPGQGEGTVRISLRRTSGPNSGGPVVTALPVWTGKWKDGNMVEIKTPSGWEKAIVVEAPTSIRGSLYVVKVEATGETIRDVLESDLR